MNRLHKSFEPLKAPEHASLQIFLTYFNGLSQDGMPAYDRFDFLDWPGMVNWMSVVHCPAGAKDRYAAENSRVLFEGSARVEMFSGDMTGQSGADLEEQFLERWQSIYALCVQEKTPIFARSEVYGMQKEFVRFEIGLFPFVDGEGALSHIISIAPRIN